MQMRCLGAYRTDCTAGTYMPNREHKIIIIPNAIPIN